MVKLSPVPVCARYSTWKRRHTIAAFKMNSAADSHRTGRRQRGIRSFRHVGQALVLRRPFRPPGRAFNNYCGFSPVPQVVNIDGVADAGYGAESTEPGVLLRIRIRIIEDVGADRTNAVQRGAAPCLPRRRQGWPTNTEPADIGGTEIVRTDLRDVMGRQPHREIPRVLAPVDV